MDGCGGNHDANEMQPERPSIGGPHRRAHRADRRRVGGGCPDPDRGCAPSGSVAGHQVSDARTQAAELQTKILALAADVSAARRSLDHVQGRLVAAQHALAAAQGALAEVQSRLDARARQAFQALGPGASASYLLGADSFADLMDRTVMLDSLQASDADLATEVQDRRGTAGRDRRGTRVGGGGAGSPVGTHRVATRRAVDRVRCATVRAGAVGRGAR